MLIKYTGIEISDWRWWQSIKNCDVIHLL